MTICFVTADIPQVDEEDVDRPYHERSFASSGLDLVYRSWTDPNVDWASYDLIVIRSVWDYVERMSEFLEFLDRLSILGTVHNPTGLIRWNLDKNYLLDLAAQDVPVVRTYVTGDLSEVDAAIAKIAASGSNEVVVKPVVSASSRLTGWFDVSDSAAVDLASRILSDGGSVIVEPFVSSVADRGEVAVIMFDGEFSHSITKGPLLSKGGGLIGGVYREDISAHVPSPSELSTATAASDAVAAIARSRGWIARDESLLYGRYDVVELGDGSSALLEAELFEPCLFVPYGQGAADRFTQVCAGRI